jgi:hypothetical protein
MATQTVAFPDDHQGAGNLDLVRQSSHAIAERLQPRAKLRTCTLPSEHPDNELNDSQRIIRICAAMNVVLEFIRTAKLRDSELLISDGTEHIEARATRQSAVEELELLREQLEQLDKENLALRDEVDRVPMFEEIVGASPALQTVLSNIVKVAPHRFHGADHRRNRNRKRIDCSRHTQALATFLPGVHLGLRGKLADLV